METQKTERCKKREGTERERENSDRMKKLGDGNLGERKQRKTLNSERGGLCSREREKKVGRKVFCFLDLFYLDVRARRKEKKARKRRWAMGKEGKQ